mmetsp:Transcript_2165/g.2264  ORF Transcript_2165/g.2264 Transcript_2165/m.2264 type:complete len:103 (-) Transcript_2165:198-506(-)
MSWVKNVGKGVKELRFIFCQNSSRSQGMRDFVAKNYLKVKEQNPTFPFIVRECEDADPNVIARYRFGIEKKAFTAGLSDQEIEKIIEDFVSKADTVNKSIQK